MLKHIFKPTTIACLLLCFVAAFSATAQTIYSTNFGTSGTSFPTGWTASGAQSANMQVSSSSVSSGYTGASGSNNMSDGNSGPTAGTAILTVSGQISTVGFTSINVSYGARKTAAYTGTITFEWSNNGSTWNTITFTDVAANSTWGLISPSTLPVGAEGQANLRFRWTFVRSNASGNYRIDDFTVTGTASPTNYYSKSSGNLNDVATWGTNTDGTGTAPANFTANLQTFNLRNGNSGALSSSWTISGTASKLVIEQTDLTIGSTNAVNATIDVNAGRTLTIQNTTQPTLGTLAATSTVVYSGLTGGVALPSGVNYGNITFDNSTVTNPGASQDLNFRGNLTLQNSAAMNASNLNLVTGGTADQTITGNSLTISVRQLENNNAVSKTGKLTLAANTNITLANSIIMNNTGTANQFVDGGNTITVLNNITLGGAASGYNLTGTMVLATTSGTGNLRGDGASATAPLAEFNNLTISTTGTTAVNFRPTTPASNIVVKGNLTFNQTSTGAVSFNANSIKVGGLFSYTPTTDYITPGTSTLEFNGTGAQTYSTGVVAGSTFNNVTVNNSGSGLTLSSPMNVSAGLTLTAGPVALGSNTLNVAGALANNVTVSGTGKIVLNGGAAQTITGNGSISNLELNNSAGATITLFNFVNITNTYTPTSGSLTTNGGLILKSTSLANTARVAAGATGGSYLSGNVTVERFIPGRRAFRFLAHPFSGTVALTALTDDIDITGDGGAAPFTLTSTNSPSAFYFDVSASDNSTTGVNPGWIAYVTADVWGVNQAMRVLIRGAKTEGLTNGAYTPSNVTIDMDGPLTQGNQTLTLTHGTGDFVVVANPFASQVNMDGVTHSNINANYYVWNAQGGTRGIYQTETRGTTGYILPSCASYVAVFTAGGNGSAAFEEGDKSSATPGAMLKTTAIANMVKLDITDSTTYWDGFRIHFDNAAMSTKENSDARKLYNPETNFYSFSKDDSTLAVDVRPYADGEVIPMGFTTPYIKGFKIVASSFDMPVGTKLFLTDKYLNKTTEITAGFEYAFTVTADSASQGNKRFELNAQGKVVTTGITTQTASKLKVKLVPNPTTNNVTIYYEGAGKELNIVVTNMIGVKVAEATQTTVNGSVTIPMQQAAAGMYIVTIKNGNETLTQKLIKQ